MSDTEKEEIKENTGEEEKTEEAEVEKARQTVLTQRVLSFALWRESITSLDESEIEELRAAEETLKPKFDELELEPSVSTELSKDEQKALKKMEEVFARRNTPLPERKGKQPSMVEANIESIDRPQSYRPPKKKKPKDPKNEGAVEPKQMKAPHKHKVEDGAYPSVTLSQLPKGHVRQKAKTFGARAGIKKEV